MRILQPPGWAAPKGYANGVAARGPDGVRRRADRLERRAALRDDRFRRPGAAGARQRRRRPGARRARRPEHIARMTWYVVDKREYLASGQGPGRRLPRDHGPPLSGDDGGRGDGADRGRARGSRSRRPRSLPVDAPQGPRRRRRKIGIIRHGPRPRRRDSGIPLLARSSVMNAPDPSAPRPRPVSRGTIRCCSADSSPRRSGWCATPRMRTRRTS